MAYAVIRHADKSGVGFSNSNPKTASLGRTIKFLKALEDGAVYFNSRDGGKQYVVNVSTSLKSQPEIEKAIRDNLASRNSTRDLIVPSSEVTKAAQQLLGFLKHSDESSDDEVIIDEGVEIIDAPYPEHGKAQIPRRCFIYDDEDGYPEGYQGFIEHHGILGMKWGVRRYQNADGSLTIAGKKHYSKGLATKNKNINYQMKLRSEPKLQAEKEISKHIDKYSKRPSDKKKETLSKEINNRRVSAAMYTSWRDFGGMEDYGISSVFKAERDYDQYANHIRSKYGQTGLDEVNEYIRVNNIDIGNKNFEKAVNNRLEYEKLYEENQRRINTIYK